MTVLLGALFSGGLFLILPLVLFLLFSKEKSPFRSGVFFGTIHFCLILALAVFIFVQVQRDGDAVMLFLIAYGVDLPVSLLTVPIGDWAAAILGQNFMLANFWVPAAVFLLFGSLQYFFIGLGLGHLFKKFFSNKSDHFGKDVP